jgi:opacity protein-like surface antigen
LLLKAALASEIALMVSCSLGTGGPIPAERWALFVTGGLAYGETEYEMMFSQPGANRFYTLSDSDTRLGWTIDGAVADAFDSNWIIKLEYLYIDLGTRKISTVDVDGILFHARWSYRADRAWL